MSQPERTATTKPTIHEKLSELRTVGVDLNVFPHEEGTMISATYAGLTKTLVINPTQEVRIIRNPNFLQETVDYQQPRPLLAIIEKDRSITVAELTYPTGKASATALSVPNAQVKTKETRIKRIPLGAFVLERQHKSTFASTLPKIGNNSIDIKDIIRQATTEIRQSPILIGRQKKENATKSNSTFAETVLNSSNPEVTEFFLDARSKIVSHLQYLLSNDTQAASAKTRIRRALNLVNAVNTTDDITPDDITTAATVEVLDMKRRVLTELGLRIRGNLTMDQAAQMFLETARKSVSTISESDIARLLKTHLRLSDPELYSRMRTANPSIQREEVAWHLANSMAENALIESAEKNATKEDLDAAVNTTDNFPRVAEQTIFFGAAKNVAYDNGERIPSRSFFVEFGRSPLSVDRWCELPLRPVVTPTKNPERGTEALAGFLFDEIFYSRQVCDRAGRQVGMDPETRREYVNKIKFSIENGIQIVATEYTPLAAIGNPFKRNTQGVALAEIDFMRRLAEISKAVEMYYRPGLVWIVGNEVPAFHGPDMLSLPKDYVYQFHATSEELMRKIDPEGNRLTMINLADMLWGTPKRHQDWMRYKNAKDSQMRDAFDNPDHPEHAQITESISTFSYPMATCINPYQFESANSLTTAEIIQIYSALKQITGSEIRGVGVSNEENISTQQLSPKQRELLNNLQSRGRNMAFEYRATMDSRDVLPVFKEVIPPYSIAYTMVTKKNKPVLYPNSGHGAYFPAHGEPVLLRPHGPKQRTLVTVRPWWQITTQAKKYRPIFAESQHEPLYFEEIM